LHKGLQPFTGAGLHKKGVHSLGDVRWGACLPYQKWACSPLQKGHILSTAGDALIALIVKLQTS
jgi:hypothetical protein